VKNPSFYAMLIALPRLDPRRGGHPAARLLIYSLITALIKPYFHFRLITRHTAPTIAASKSSSFVGLV